MALILCTGIDQALLNTRKLILERAGHTVLTTADERELHTLCERLEFNVVVIGQTVSPNSKRLIGSIVRACCRSAKILELYQVHHGRVLDDADSWLLVPADVPEDLVKQVTELAETKRRPRPHRRA